MSAKRKRPVTKPKRPIGRPRKLQAPIDREKILAVLSVGCSRQDAANYLGIRIETIRNEEKRDPEFFSQLKKAEGACKVALVKKIRDGKEWQTAAWLLERKWPQEFGRRDHHEISGSLTIAHMTDDEIKELAVSRGLEVIEE